MKPREFSKILTVKKMKDIKERAEKGERLYSIGEAYGCSGETIRQLCIKNKWKYGPAGNYKISIEQMKYAKKEYEKSKREMSDIAKELGVTVENILYTAKRDKWKLRAKKKWILRSELNDYKRLYEVKGWPITQIAILHGISSTAMRNWAIKENWRIRSISESKLRASVIKRKSKGIQERQYSEFKLYCKQVHAETMRNYKKYKNIIDKDNKRSRDFHIDHALSKYDGFFKYKNPVPVEIVAHPCNLRLITQNENNKKSKNSSINKSKLLDKIKKFKTS